MEYHGKLYGHLGGGKYFDTSHTTDEWDLMVEKIALLEAENRLLTEKIEDFQKTKFPHPNCDEACYYHCTKGGNQFPDCVNPTNP
jgi:hypothetical protein